MKGDNTHHEIAGIVFHSKWNNWIPVIKAHNFNKFQTNNKFHDIENEFYEIKEKSKIIIPTKNEINSFLKYSNWINRIDSPLLNYVETRDRIASFLNKNPNPDLLICWNLIIMRDFKTKQMELIFSHKFGGYHDEYKGFIPQNYIGANLRFVFSTFLNAFSSILLHSSGVILNESAAIFLAPDEGGKTTAIKLFEGTSILSEDQIICRIEKGNVFAHSTPLGGKTVGPIHANCGGIFLLEKASSFEVIPIRPIELIQYIWNEHKNYIFYLPKSYRKGIFKLVWELCHQVPIFRLRFQKNYIDWDVIKKAINTK